MPHGIELTIKYKDAEVVFLVLFLIFHSHKNVLNTEHLSDLSGNLEVIQLVRKLRLL
jgi:hypothetical protein